MESLQPLITHRFWVLFGVSVLLVPLGWFLGVGSLKEKIQAGESAIKSATDSIPKGKNPNPDWIKGGQLVNDKRTGFHDKHANVLYRQQRNLQTWPASIASTFKDIPYLGEVPPEDCSVYRDAYFRDSIPRLYRIVDPVIVPNPKEDPEKYTGKVVFEYDDLPKVPYATWARRAPESRELWDAQEDVWLLTALLKSIARVNRNDERIDTATIRRILHISLHGGTAESADGEQTGGEQGGGGMGMTVEGGIGSSSSAPKGMGEGMGLGRGGESGGADVGFNSIMIKPEDYFGKLRPRKSKEGGEETANNGGGVGMMNNEGALSIKGMGGGNGSNKDKMSPYVDENPEDPFKTRGFVMVVLMKRREIIRLQEQLGLMSFPVEIKLVQHVDRDPDLKGISIFREAGAGAGIGGEGGGGRGEDPMEGGRTPMGGRIPGGLSVGRPSGGGGLGRPIPPRGGAGGAGNGVGGRNAAPKLPSTVRAALEDHGLCYVTVAGLMTIYQPPKPKAKSNTANPAPPEQKPAEPKQGELKQGQPTNSGNPKPADPMIKVPAMGQPSGKQPVAPKQPPMKPNTKPDPSTAGEPKQSKTAPGQPASPPKKPAGPAGKSG